MQGARKAEERGEEESAGEGSLDFIVPIEAQPAGILWQHNCNGYGVN